MLTLRFDYPALTKEHNAPIYEKVRAELRPEKEFLDHYEPGHAVAELRAHAIYMPLAPGDIVVYNIDTGAPTRLLYLAPLWTIDCDFAIPANLVTGQGLPLRAQRVIDRVTGEWQREAWVTQHTGLSFYVSAADREWLEDRVMGCEYVDHLEMIRHPSMQIDLDVAIQNANLADLKDGPWS